MLVIHWYSGILKIDWVFVFEILEAEAASTTVEGRFGGTLTGLVGFLKVFAGRSGGEDGRTIHELVVVGFSIFGIGGLFIIGLWENGGVFSAS